MLKNIVFLLVLVGLCLGCPRTPKGIPYGRKKSGDNGYRIIVKDAESGYEPGKIYNVFLLGSRTHSNLQQFTHFTLTALPANGSNPTRNRSDPPNPKRVGRFQLFPDSLTKFSDHCVNTVSQSDDYAKTEIQAMWVAPAKGSGCVAIAAMVYENRRSWYADDGGLTQILCESKSSHVGDNEECCACDEAKYNFIFQGLWTNETHPKDYPFAVWLTHFSDIIGATHDSNFSFWGENHIASDGFKSLAEWGSIRLMETELRAKGPRLRTLIKAAGLWYPNVNSNTSSHFKVDRKHPKLSLATMIGPSPDWVLGVSGLNLCLKNCSWQDSLDIDLYLWDAGTDNGISYMSPNADTQPRERMTRITTMYPEDPRSPFYDPHAEKMQPFARLFIRKERNIPRNCDDTFLQQVLDVAENSDDEASVPPECETSPYSDWSPCSVTCGKGLRMRTRAYVSQAAATRANCKRQLISKEMCVADIAECIDDAEPEEEEDNLAMSSANVDEDGEGTGVCRTTKWSEWSECSSSCGVGISMRTRTFVDHMGRKKCPHITIVEKEKCMKPECSLNDLELPDPMCPTTPWSDWSPCTKTCGRGITIRTRLLLLPPEFHSKCTDRVQLNQQKICSQAVDCTVDAETAKVYCAQSIETGPCRGRYERFAYDPASRHCVSFTYGGCRGNQNNFLTYDDCANTCNST